MIKCDGGSLLLPIRPGSAGVVVWALMVVAGLGVGVFAEQNPWPVVQCQVETTPIAKEGDAADDPAVWVNAADPARSLIIGTDKKAGLHVYTLGGVQVQSLLDGRMNNVDVLHNVPASAPAPGTVDMVFASNRTGDLLAAYLVDRATGVLSVLPGGPFDTDLKEVYGVCAYLDSATGLPHVVVNDKTGAVRIYRLTQGNAGAWSTAVVSSFHVGTQVEGCVADTANGWLYIGEECVGLWRYPLPGYGHIEEGPARTLVDVVRGPLGGKDGGNLARDVEGVSIWEGPGRSGWIVVSCQGEDRYAVYSRETGVYVGSFRLSFAGPHGLDPVTHTDGVTVTSEPLGPSFPRGAIVVQDDNNGSMQNFKVADWRLVEEALSLNSGVGVKPAGGAGGMGVGGASPTSPVSRP